MNKDALIKQLMATYLEELDEQVRALNRDLLELEKTPPKARCDELYKSLLRTAHTLKGASTSVEIRPVALACHQLEDALAAMQRGELAPSAELFAALFALADSLEEAGNRLRREESLADATFAGVLSRLLAIESGDGRPAAREGGMPAETIAEVAPAAQAVPLPPIAAPRDAALPSALSEAAAGGPKDGDVRVSAAKLDALLAQSGEFLTAQRQLQLHVKEAEALIGFVARWRIEWATTTKSIHAALLRRGIDRNNVLPAPLRPVIRTLPELLAGTSEKLSRLQIDSNRLLAKIAADMNRLEAVADSLSDNARRVRMLPFAQACLGLDRMARDLAQESGKQVALTVDADEVEIDRSVLEGMKDTLRHLVRNAIHHGVETPDERRAAGKPSLAQVSITAALRGSEVEVGVADDGRGLDLAALRAALRKRQIPEPAGARELAHTIFMPGISTARQVTGVSGRGVGLDVVKTRAEAAHGGVDVAFEPGRGTRVTVFVPLTLTSLRALLATVAGQTYGFIASNVDRVGRIGLAALKRVAGRQRLLLDDELIPVASLAEILGTPRSAPLADGRTVPFLVIASGGRRVAVLVDEYVAEQEIMIKSLGARLEGIPHFSGATVLPSGRIALVLNAASLIRAASEQSPFPLPPTPAAPKKRLLLAEDSATTRTLIASILKEAGYDVTATPDGAEAWRRLQENGADLLITDVAMPRMDGFALTEAVRHSSQFRELPVVLLTSRETNEDKARGAAAGANAYLVKSAFDQRSLLETINQLV